MGTSYESGVIQTREKPSSIAPDGLARDCHEIIDAASALIVNVEFMARDGEPSRVAAAEDARQSVHRIVRIARAMRKQALDAGSAAEANGPSGSHASR